MLDSLGRIQNPFVRSLTAGVVTSSALTIAAAIALGLSGPQEKPAYRTALTSILAGTVCSAVFGFLYTDKHNLKSASNQASAPLPSADASGWTTWRPLVVIRKVRESEEITSFYFKPMDQGTLPNFQPGQFLTIQLDIPGQPRPVIRTYSLSDYQEPCDYYRLSIKREPAPAGLAVMAGIASNFMHDQVAEGTVIMAKPPSGKFVLDLHQSLPAVLISNGVGITPMISMMKAAVRHSQRPVWFVHGARSGPFHAFREEVAHIAQHHPAVQVHIAYSRPQAEDTGHYHSTGYVDTPLIQSLVQQEAEYFLCGSPDFMRSLRQGLAAAGVPESRVFFEAFTKASTKPEATDIAGTAPTQQAEVVFARSGKTVSWTSGDGTLLEWAEANQLNPDYSCRQGICGTCMCRLLEGEVEYETPPSSTIDDGAVLICISHPKSARVVLDL